MTKNPAFEKFKEEFPDVYTALNDLYITVSSKALDEKTKQLVYLGILTATRYSPAVGVHIKKALAAGATEDEIKEAMILAIPASGLGFTLEVPALAEELDDLFTAARVDFMAIGTSDLFSLFNGVCRNNQALSVLPTSKANICLLRRVVACAREHGVHTFVCGEVRRNEELMTELLQAGVGELICSSRVKELSTVFRLSGARRSAT